MDRNRCGLTSHLCCLKIFYGGTHAEQIDIFMLCCATWKKNQWNNKRWQMTAALLPHCSLLSQALQRDFLPPHLQAHKGNPLQRPSSSPHPPSTHIPVGCAGGHGKSSARDSLAPQQKGLVCQRGVSPILQMCLKSTDIPNAWSAVPWHVAAQLITLHWRHLFLGYQDSLCNVTHSLEENPLSTALRLSPYATKETLLEIIVLPPSS